MTLGQTDIFTRYDGLVVLVDRLVRLIKSVERAAQGYDKRTGEALKVCPWCFADVGHIECEAFNDQGGVRT